MADLAGVRRLIFGLVIFLLFLGHQATGIDDSPGQNWKHEQGLEHPQVNEPSDGQDIMSIPAICNSDEYLPGYPKPARAEEPSARPNPMEPPVRDTASSEHQVHDPSNFPTDSFVAPSIPVSGVSSIKITRQAKNIFYDQLPSFLMEHYPLSQRDPPSQQKPTNSKGWEKLELDKLIEDYGKGKFPEIQAKVQRILEGPVQGELGDQFPDSP
ncbi:hypothetical protein IWQ61_006119 [Dispira simplex]|nr:hypothetical protein IWQ61_006119 [Dispira simplex]